ncbi:hypothetical protein HK097_007764 [Rhizophlyctis rosea]|uniref:Mitotic checkpoint protein and poly(A)+ RNA export protein n=1 Tax=Rhizophlyctis rosea TaxID=64517 RepID=A0AAD5SDF2_9FUNG|nr:hypothetical protein HK097_007764 [Rhizophlyctis rosea]
MLQQQQQPQPKDFEVQPNCPDGISDLHFSPTSELLAVSCWDGNTRIWEVMPNGSANAKVEIAHGAPSLCVRFSADGSKLFSGSADKTGKIMDLTTGQTIQAVQHDAPFRCVRWLNYGNTNGMLVTGGWDKTLRYWDLRQPTPAHVAQLNDRVYAMDSMQNLLVVGCANREVVLYNLNNPQQSVKTLESPLKFQTRTLACFPDARGFAIGSVEGRVGIQYVEAKDNGLNFSFKCHRDDKNIFSVNSIQFHPVLGTFSTAGSDGGFNFWDKDSKQRLKAFPVTGIPIPCSAFSRTGNIFAYAQSYDWSKGVDGSLQGTKHQVMLHATKDEDVRPRPAKGKR